LQCCNTWSITLPQLNLDLNITTRWYVRACDFGGCLHNVNLQSLFNIYPNTIYQIHTQNVAHPPPFHSERKHNLLWQLHNLHKPQGLICTMQQIKKLNNNELKWFFLVQNFNDLNHMRIDNVVKLYIIMIGIQAIKGSWWTLMNEINKTLWWKHDDSLVNNGDPLTNLTTPFNIFDDVHKWSFNMMVKSCH
jgi:hypothetical protein